MTDYIVSVDLGQTQDPSALVILACHWPAYHVVHLEHMLGWPYPQVVARVRSRILALPTPRTHWLMLDATGVGRAICDMFEAGGMDPLACTIHGGDQVHTDGRNYRVPKRDLCGALVRVFQESRLLIARQLPLAQTLIDELLAFRVKIDIGTGHDTYQAWSEKDRDDLVLATAMGVWMAEWLKKTRTPAVMMERGLTNVQLSRAHTNTADRPQRPRFRPDRFTDVTDEPDAMTWDDIKHGVADGTIPPPSRSPWVD
jgi:hypothetical protein